MQKLKSGFTTSEFVVIVLGIILIALVMLGFISQADADQVWALVVTILGGTTGIAALGMRYAHARTSLKMFMEEMAKKAEGH